MVINPAQSVAFKFKTQVFFNRNVIKSNWKSINEGPLKKAGLLVRKIARGSIRRGTTPKQLKPAIVVGNVARNLQTQGYSRSEAYKEAWNRFKLGQLSQRKKRKPSKVGRPPKSWGTGKNPPFKMIYSVPNKMGTSVIVGMVGFGSKGQPVPGLHEQGGFAQRSVYKTTRVLGKQGRSKKGRFTSRRVTTNVRRVTTIVRYPKRAFMVPALLKGKSKVPHLWKNSLRK